MENPQKNLFTVLLFYKYIPISNTKEIIEWQTTLCNDNNLVGRIIVSPEGLNGTLCGKKEECESYMALMREHELFSDINFKINYSPFICFSKLKVKFRPEIVMLRYDELAAPAASDINEYFISADELHTLLLESRKDVVLLDIRNDYESRIGHFDGAIIPQINNSRHFYDYFRDNKELFIDKHVIMYCSGGVRVERTSTALRKLGVCKSIRNLKNGIHAYIEKYPQGFFKGRYYVFDDRISIKVTDDVLTQCDICTQSCDLYNNCLNALCNKHYISCDECLKKSNGCCSEQCIDLTEKRMVPLRPALPSRDHAVGDVTQNLSCTVCYCAY